MKMYRLVASTFLFMQALCIVPNYSMMSSNNNPFSSIDAFNESLNGVSSSLGNVETIVDNLAKLDSADEVVDYFFNKISVIKNSTAMQKIKPIADKIHEKTLGSEDFIQELKKWHSEVKACVSQSAGSLQKVVGTIGAGIHQLEKACSKLDALLSDFDNTVSKAEKKLDLEKVDKLLGSIQKTINMISLAMVPLCAIPAIQAGATPILASLQTANLSIAIARVSIRVAPKAIHVFCGLSKIMVGSLQHAFTSCKDLLDNALLQCKSIDSLNVEIAKVINTQQLEMVEENEMDIEVNTTITTELTITND